MANRRAKRMAAKNKELILWLRNADSLTLIAHVSPDGDTIGSTLALYHALNGSAQLVCEDTIPPKYAFLPGASDFRTPDKAHHTKYVLAVDAADLGRLGTAVGIFEAAEYTAVIDHHGTNPGYAQLNRIECDYGATGTIVHELLSEGCWPLTEEIALCLYVAISTDTGNFSFSSTRCRDMQAAAVMVELFDVADTTRRLFRCRRREYTLLLGAMLSDVRFYADGRIACGFVTEEMLQKCGAEYSDTEGLIDHLINMEGVEIALLATQKNGAKFSVRTLEADAAAIAKRFGGGGHTRAAGMTVQAAVYEAMDEVVAVACEAMK